MKCSYSCCNYDYLFSFRTIDLNNPFNYEFTIPPDIDIKYLENAVFTIGFAVIPVSMYMYVYYYKLIIYFSLLCHHNGCLPCSYDNE